MDLVVQGHDSALAHLSLSSPSRCFFKIKTRPNSARPPTRSPPTAGTCRPLLPHARRSQRQFPPYPASRAKNLILRSICPASSIFLICSNQELRNENFCHYFLFRYTSIIRLTNDIMQPIPEEKKTEQYSEDGIVLVVSHNYCSKLWHFWELNSLIPDLGAKLVENRDKLTRSSQSGGSLAIFCVVRLFALRSSCEKKIFITCWFI